MTDVQTRFRITPWPQRPLPHPGHHGAAGLVLDRESGAIRWDGRPSADETPLTGEAYLELAALELDDLDSVERFLVTYGPLELRWDTPGWLMEKDYQGFNLHPGYESVVLPRLRDARERAQAFDPDPVETLEEFRFGALCLRDLVTAWRVVQGLLPLERAEWVSPVWEDTSEKLETYPWNDEITEREGAAYRADGPASILTLYLSAALEPFAPRLAPAWADPGAAFGEGAALYNRLCLELFNHIVEEAPYRHCANETCGRLFTRQSGRAKHGQHRSTGVMYCSMECARNQAQRQHRRRRRAASAKRQTLRPLAVERDVSNTILLRQPRITLPVDSGWIRDTQKSEDDYSDFIEAYWELDWHGRQLEGLRLHVKDNQKHHLTIECDPTDRDHVAAALNSTAPGSIEIAAPDAESTQISAMIDEPVAMLLSLRHPGLEALAPALENAWLNGPELLDEIEDAETAAKARASLERAAELAPEFPGLVTTAEHLLRPELLGLVGGQIKPPPAFPNPATRELMRSMLIGISFPLELHDAEVRRAPARRPGPPPSPARLASLVEMARSFPGRIPGNLVVDFCTDSVPEALPLRDGSQWPLWAAFLSVEDDVVEIVPAGRLVADEPEPYLACGISIGPDDEWRDDPPVVVARDGLHISPRPLRKEIGTWPPHPGMIALAEADFHEELLGYWSSLVPSLLERIVAAVDDLFPAPEAR